MKPDQVEKEIVDLEKRYWQALQEQDVDTALALTDEPCIVTGPQGVGCIEKPALAAMMKTAPYVLRAFELEDDIQVRLLGDDVAIVAYTVREELTVDGAAVTLKAADASTWVRRQGRWVCALHTEALAGDPYGRDRHHNA
jgi:hypothetical protein